VIELFVPNDPHDENYQINKYPEWIIMSIIPVLRPICHDNA